MRTLRQSHLAMVLLPLVGFLAGVLIGDRRAFPITAAAAAIGFALVASLTDEIDGWGDPFVWGVTVVSLLATLVGIGARRGWKSMRERRARPA